jgi:hypothetical protein
MLDLDSPAAESALAKIRTIAGVMTVRVLPQRQD